MIQLVLVWHRICIVAGVRDLTCSHLILHNAPVQANVVLHHKRAQLCLCKLDTLLGSSREVLVHADAAIVVS